MRSRLVEIASLVAIALVVAAGGKIVLANLATHKAFAAVAIVVLIVCFEAKYGRRKVGIESSIGCALLDRFHKVMRICSHRFCAFHLKRNSIQFGIDRCCATG